MAVGHGPAAHLRPVGPSRRLYTAGCVGGWDTPGHDGASVSYVTGNVEALQLFVLQSIFTGPHGPLYRDLPYGACVGTTLMLLNGEPLISFVLTTV